MAIRAATLCGRAACVVLLGSSGALAQQQGLPLWESEMAPTVNSAWIMLCSM